MLRFRVWSSISEILSGRKSARHHGVGINQEKNIHFDDTRSRSVRIKARLCRPKGRGGKHFPWVLQVGSAVVVLTAKMGAANSIAERDGGISAILVGLALLLTPFF